MAGEGLVRITRSVGAKLFSLVFLVLLLNLGILGYVNVRLQRLHLERARIAAARRMSSIVLRTTSYYMLRNDRAAMRYLIDTMRREPGVTSFRITPDRAGAPRTQTLSIRPANGARILTTLTPIRNSESCASAACHAHPASQKILGMLEIDLSLAAADSEVSDAMRQFILSSALAILATLIATGLFVWHFVHKPVSELAAGTERLRSGELGYQIPVRSHDQLGQLAGSFNQMSCQLHDAHDRLEERVTEKTAELHRAYDQMIHAEKLTSLGKLAAVVAHEINNPLSGILTYAKLLRRWIERGDSLEQRAGEMRESLALIESESRRCGDIVRNLLTFARVHPLNISDVDINRLVHQCIRLIEHKLDLGNITPELDLDDNLPPLRGDSGQLEQLLLALIMNAIEAMPHEGNLHITTSASADRSSVVIAIEDDGIGIPPEFVPHLFEPFVTTKEDGKGVGLGLAVSRTIVDRHNGRIDVKSEVGRGTTFTIVIPRAAMPTQHKEVA